MSFAETLNKIVERRQNELAEADALFLRALKTNPELYDTEKKLRAAKLDRVKGLERDELIGELREKKTRLLDEMGIGPETLAPPPRCRDCGDTGRVNGSYCRCVAAEEIAAAGTAFLHSFGDCDFSVFPQKERQAAQRVYDTMENYCRKFPDTNKKTVVLMGRCGTGKSFLASCVGEELTRRGFAVLMVSSYEFVSRMLELHLAPQAEKKALMEPFIACPLLIIDDLGSEKKLNNVSEEYLYEVLCEREARDLHTFVTTNLDEQLLDGVYGERIVSRLFDKRRSFYCTVGSTDLRRNR